MLVTVIILSLTSAVLAAALVVALAKLKRRQDTDLAPSPITENQENPLNPTETLPFQTLLIRTTNEMRTPLNSIVGLTAVLEDAKLNTQQKESVKMIRLAGDNLLSLIKDIQYYSRIETGSEPSETAELNLATLTEELMEDVSDLIGTKPIELAVFIDPSLPTNVQADAQHVRQILNNLVSNAAKFTRSGEIIVTIKPVSQAGSDASFLSFQIKDTGIGISEEHLARIFSPIDPNSFGKEDFLFGGFGLYISQKLCELIGGEMTATSREYEGSTFTFTVPFQIPESADSGYEAAVSFETKADHPEVIIATVSANLGNSLAQQFERNGLHVRSQPNESGLVDILTGPGEANAVLLFDAEWAVRPSDKEYRWTEKLKRCKTPTIILTSDSTQETFAKDTIFSQIQQVNRPIRPSRIIESLRHARTPMQVKDSTPMPFVSPKATRDPMKIASGAQGSLKILVAEDDKVNQKVITMMLKRLGHETALANDGVEALEHANKERFDLILMDLNMPNLGGIDATKRLFKQIPNANERPVVVAITAAVTPANQQACREVGMKGFISKPVKLAVLKKALSTIKPRSASLV